MMALTQGNRDTNGNQILDLRLQSLPQTNFRVWRCTAAAPNTPGTVARKHLSQEKDMYLLLCTSMDTFFSVLYFYDHSEFLMLLEMWNSAGKVPFYLTVRMMGPLSLLFVPKSPHNSQDNPIHRVPSFLLAFNSHKPGMH